jgi:hypothetical protein
VRSAIIKKFLLTWYGITDLRASLGFESTGGPIAAALAAEDYSDVIVLCYTRHDDGVAEGDAQEAFQARLISIREAGLDKDGKTTGEFISTFANTSAAHGHFIGWLKDGVAASSKGTRIVHKSETLRGLNDTEGIHACAIRALDLVAQEPGEKLVTLYLSPGTPVMAFVWALAALGYPELKKRLIASSVVGRPPETVSLPAEWLDRHAARQSAMRQAPDGFDVTFHLFGEQRMPALLGVRQFPSDHHVFVNSSEYPASCMRAFTHPGGFEELCVDPWDARAVNRQIMAYAADLPSNTRVGVNLTGGTKLMFAGALSAARAIGAVPFYFDSRNRRVTFVDTLRSSAILPVDSVETFFSLNGDGLELAEPGLLTSFSPERRLLTETLWQQRESLAAQYGRLRQICEDHEALRRRHVELTPFKIECGGLVLDFDRHRTVTVTGGSLDLHIEDWPGFASYLCGGWFEEHVYLQCKPYEEDGVIRDLRLNFELRLDQKCVGRRTPWNSSYNELDVVFTDGHSLYIVECKAGKVTQEQVMKLQNLVRLYGGVEGRGIVAACFPPRAEAIQKKIGDAKLSLWCGDSFPEQLKALMQEIAARAAAVRESS